MSTILSCKTAGD